MVFSADGAGETERVVVEDSRAAPYCCGVDGRLLEEMSEAEDDAVKEDGVGLLVPLAGRML